ncbi:hypothetical protein ACHAXT_008128 [Thalassiosira profunda]
MASTQPLRALLRHSASARGSFVGTSGRSTVTNSLPIAASHAGASFGHQSQPLYCAHSLQTAAGFQRRAISATAPKRVISWVQEKISGRNEAKAAAKLVENVNKMADSPTWTAKQFEEELDWQTSQWMAKLPGTDSNELQQAKDAQQVIKVLIEQLGEGATYGDIAKMDRRAKLKLVIACKKPMSEVEQAISLFNQNDIMHRVLRNRKKSGIDLPKDKESLQMAMQMDGMKVMTKKELEEMKKLYEKFQMAQMKGES